jgi:alpha-galactosidase
MSIHPQCLARSIRLAMFLLATGVVAASAQTAATSLEAERQRETEWTQQHLVEHSRSVPFSFVYDGVPSASLLATWPRKESTMPLDAHRRQHTLSWSDPKTGLQVTCVAVEYDDFPAVEWTVYFKNAGQAETPILEKIEAIDSDLSGEKSGDCHLHYVDGDGETHGQAQFAPQEKVLTPGASIQFAPLDGRPTDGSFPYYNLDWQGNGTIVVLGWPGQWSTAFTSPSPGVAHLAGGQALTHLRLQPGEEIRTPRITMLFWQRDNWIEAQNLWRHWMRAHNVPKPGGHEVPVVRAGGGFLYDKFGWGGNLLNEHDQIDLMDHYAAHGIKLNTWWIDILGAGTFVPYSDSYNTTPGPNIQSWDTDRTRFPHGLRAVSDHARQLGEKTLVWIEPEHITKPNVLFRDHPDWMLTSPDDPAVRKQINQGVVLGDRMVLNLGNRGADDWIIGRLSRLIRDEGVEIYRQDFNITPLLFWHFHDAPDRQGMTENLYVQGYLRLLDSLAAHHPGLMIDTCASGGRRDDLETLRRAVPLWRSDAWGLDVILQNQTYGLALWVPYFGTGTHATDPYAYRSSLGSSLFTSWDVRDPALNYAEIGKLENEFWKTAPFFHEDYYPLTPYDSGPGTWMAWQFNRPEKGDGIVQAFRRDQNNDGPHALRLEHLDADAKYEITDMDSPTTRIVSGSDLMQTGLVVSISAKPGAAVFLYRKISH